MQVILSDKNAISRFGIGGFRHRKFDPKTSDEKLYDFIMGKDRTESICIEARYKDIIFGVPHTETFRFPFYSNRYQPKTEIQEISSWLRNIRDEMRGISSNLISILSAINNSKKNQEK